MERSLDNCGNTDETAPWELHRAVFENRHVHLETVLAALKQAGTCDQTINTKDRHGNTPLHLAVLLNRTECLEILLAYNARTKTKNSEGWSALAEAVGCGNRAVVKRLVSRVLNRDGQDAASSQQSADNRGNRMKLQQTLESVPDFQLDIEWQFKTWIPLASRFMPSDICRVSKCGTRIRVDSTLIDFQNMKWERGNVSYLFDPIVEKVDDGAVDAADAADDWSRHPVYVIDHDRRVYSPFMINDESNDMEEDVNMLMTTPLHQMDIVSKNAYVSRIQTGWFMKEAKTERIADKYMCDFYSVHNIRVVTTKRTEHLSPDDLLKSKKMLKEMLVDNESQPIVALEADESDSDDNNATNTATATKQDAVNNNHNHGSNGGEGDGNGDFVEAKITWDEYIGAEPGQYQSIRPRPVIQTVKSKELKLTVALSKEFPISMRVLTELLEVVAPLSRFKKLRDFMDLKLPLKSEGFPVRIEFPVFPGITAQVTFLNFEWQSSPTATNGNTQQSYAELFTIPNNYTLDSNTRCTWLTG